MIMLFCVGCEWHLKPNSGKDAIESVAVDRYDRIQSMYLTTGDFSALQQLNTGYPMETRTLIEDILRIGRVNDPEINTKFLHFYQDTTLQSLISEVEQQYANMDDINKQLAESFKYLNGVLPDFEIPKVYSQIGSLDQSIIVGNNTIGICLDKYLGENYELYLNPDYGYTKGQRSMMQRSFIVPDCIGFYLLSLYPMPQNRALSQNDRDLHMGKIQWVVNKATKKRIFRNSYVKTVDKFMRHHKDMTAAQLLECNDYQQIMKYGSV